VRGDAIAHLVPLLRARVDVEHVGSLDFLDPFRRLEQALPKVCDELERAARLPVIPAARALLELGARELPDLVGPAARAAVEKVLGEAEAAAAEHARH
jgi:hypothetical protein